MRASKTRYQLFLPDDLSQRLETLAAEPGSSKSAILTAALRAWLDRRGEMTSTTCSAPGSTERAERTNG
jgi:predicted transcriptional regulator